MDKKDLTETLQGVGQWFIENAESIAMQSMSCEKLSIKIEFSELFDIVFPKIDIEHYGKPPERYVPGYVQQAQEMGYPVDCEDHS